MSEAGNMAIKRAGRLLLGTKQIFPAQWSPVMAVL
jgi:hypothetical protein